VFVEKSSKYVDQYCRELEFTAKTVEMAARISGAV
jgi:hypothetical protein